MDLSTLIIIGLVVFIVWKINSGKDETPKIRPRERAKRIEKPMLEEETESTWDRLKRKNREREEQEANEESIWAKAKRENREREADKAETESTWDRLKRENREREEQEALKRKMLEKQKNEPETIDLADEEPEDNADKIIEEPEEAEQTLTTDEAKPKPKKKLIRKTWIVSEHEKKMFWMLRKAVPDLYVFTQVSLGEILWTYDFRTRAKFNQKRADFVVCNGRFEIVAVIELDDKSHDGKEEQDAARDAMLQEAGYKVLRYRYLPKLDKLKSDILG